MCWIFTNTAFEKIIRPHSTWVQSSGMTGRLCSSNTESFSLHRWNISENSRVLLILKTMVYTNFLWVVAKVPICSHVGVSGTQSSFPGLFAEYDNFWGGWFAKWYEINFIPTPSGVWGMNGVRVGALWSKMIFKSLKLFWNFGIIKAKFEQFYYFMLAGSEKENLF